MKRWVILATGLTLALPAHAIDWNDVLKGVLGKPSQPASSGVGAQYVTQQALDRLYTLIGEKEAAIRANPMQAGSDLLKKSLWRRRQVMWTRSPHAMWHAGPCFRRVRAAHSGSP